MDIHEDVYGYTENSLIFRFFTRGALFIAINTWIYAWIYGKNDEIPLF